MTRIFISHSSHDNAAAAALRLWLADCGFVDVFLDFDPERGIAAGERWERALHEAASRCEAVVFLVSANWLASDWCAREFDLATSLSKRLFGVLIDGTAIDDVPLRFRRTWQFADLKSGEGHRIFRVQVPPQYEEAHVTFSAGGLKRLETGLKAAGLDPSFFEWPPADDAMPEPYKGLSSLAEAEAGIFFGRDAPLVRGLDTLRRMSREGPPRLMVVLGASGAGKSSFLRAGLWPRLKRDDRNFLPLPPIRPGRGVLTGERGLIASLTVACAAWKLGLSRSEIASAVEDDGAGLPALTGVLRRLTEAALVPALPGEAPARPPLAVIGVDQAEELFEAQGQAEGERFLALVRALALSLEVPCLVVFTIRTDAYGPLQVTQALSGLKQELFSLDPMPKGAYSDIITGPAKRLTSAGHKLELAPDLVDALLTDMEAGGAGDQLPLLAFTLQRLHAEHGGKGRITRADYESSGGVTGAIEAAVAAAMRACDADRRVPMDEAARHALLRRGLIPWLAGIDPATNIARRKVARLSDIPAEALPLIEHLVEVRLLSRDVDPTTGETTLEPAHEALLRQWRLMKGWLEEDRGLLVALEGVEQATRDWLANGRADGWLAHAAGRLEDAELLNRRPDLAAKLGAEDRAYLAACRRSEDARRNRELEDARRLAEAEQRTARRTRLGLVVASVLAVLATLGAWYGFDRAAEAERQRITAVESAVEAELQRRAARDSLALAEENERNARHSSNVAAQQQAIAEAAAVEAERQQIAAAESEARAVASAAEAQRLRSEAEASEARALDSEAQALASAALAEEQRLAAEAARAEAEHQSRIAEANASLATANAEEAERQRREAEAAAAEAERQRELAMASALVAAKNAAEAERQRGIAEANARAEERQRLAAEQATLQAQVEAREAIRSQRNALLALALARAETAPHQSIQLALAAWPMARDEPFPSASLAFAAIQAAIRRTRPLSINSQYARPNEESFNFIEPLRPLSVRDRNELRPGHPHLVITDNETATIHDSDGGPICTFPISEMDRRLMEYIPGLDRIAISEIGGPYTWLMYGARANQRDDEACEILGRIVGGPMRFSLDRRFLYIVEQGDSLRVYDVSSGEYLNRWPTTEVHSFQPISQGSLLVASDLRGIWLLDALTLEEIALLVAGRGGSLVSYQGSTFGFPYGRSSFGSSGVDQAGEVFHWHIIPAAPAFRERADTFSRSRPDLGSFGSIALAAEANRLFFGAGEGLLGIRDLESGTTSSLRLSHHQGRFHGISVSPDGSRVVTEDSDRNIWVHDSNGTLMGRLPCFHALSRDGTRALCFGYNTVNSWNVSESFVVPDNVFGLSDGEDEAYTDWRWRQYSFVGAVSAHRWVVGSFTGHVQIFDAANGSLIAQRQIWLEGRDSAMPVAISQDGEFVVLGVGEEGLLRIWNAHDGSPVGEQFGSLGDNVASVSYAPDGRRLVTGHSSGAVRLWDTSTGVMLTELPGRHAGGVTTVYFSSDSSLVISAGADGEVNAWTNLPAGNIFQVACRYLPLRDGRIDTSTTETLAQELGLPNLTLPDNCDTYDPPIPPLRPAVTSD